MLIATHIDVRQLEHGTILSFAIPVSRDNYVEKYYYVQWDGS